MAKGLLPIIGIGLGLVVLAKSGSRSSRRSTNTGGSQSTTTSVVNLAYSKPRDEERTAEALESIFGAIGETAIEAMPNADYRNVIVNVASALFTWFPSDPAEVKKLVQTDKAPWAISIWVNVNRVAQEISGRAAPTL